MAQPIASDMRLDAATLSQVNSLVSTKQYAQAYATVFNYLNANYDPPTGADRDIINWLYTAYDVNSGWMTHQQPPTFATARMASRSCSMIKAMKSWQMLISMAGVGCSPSYA